MPQDMQTVEVKPVNICQLKQILMLSQEHQNSNICHLQNCNNGYYIKLQFSYGYQLKIFCCGLCLHKTNLVPLSDDTGKSFCQCVMVIIINCQQLPKLEQENRVRRHCPSCSYLILYIVFSVFCFLLLSLFSSCQGISVLFLQTDVCCWQLLVCF